MKTDLELVKKLDRTADSVDKNFRRYLRHLTLRLTQIIQCCPISSAMDTRRSRTVRCIRHLSAAEALLRTEGFSSTRHQFFEALSLMNVPELVWHKPKVHYTIAYYDSASKNRAAAIARLDEYAEACDEVLLVNELLGMWMQVSLPTRYKSDLVYQNRMVAKGAAILRSISRKRISPVVCIAAARLATSISIATTNEKVGIRWLDRLRRALERSELFGGSAASEYHTQRALVFRASRDYSNGVADAKKAIEQTTPESSDWFSNMNTLLFLQLNNGEYEEALKNANHIVTRKHFDKQSKQRVKLAVLYSMYAGVLNGQSLNEESFGKIKDKVADAAALRMLSSANRKEPNDSDDALLSLRRLVDRSRPLRSDRGLWLLSRLAFLYAKQGQNIRLCRKAQLFQKYEAELRALKYELDNTVICPVKIWEALTRKR
ncbi:MAG: hypothetical protein SGJ05_01500 [bacterium]|nr:hypothetical protein [bacterium]